MTDIIIGARKARPRKSRRLLLLGLALVIAYVATRWTIGFLVSYPNPDASVPKDEVVASIDGDASLHYAGATYSDGDIAVVRAAGEPVVLGAAVGRLIAGDVELVSDALTTAATRSERGSDLAARFFGQQRGEWKLRHVDDGIPGHQLVEVSALVAGARRSQVDIDYESFVRAQAGYDFASPDPHSRGDVDRALTRGLTIATPLRGASGERLLFARSFATPGLPPIETRPVVRFFRPQGVIAFAAIGEAATVGVLTGINAEGLVVSAHPIATVDGTADEGQPVPLLVRDILENARSTEQAISILEAAKPLGSAIYVVADAASSAPAVAERTPKRFGVLAERSTRVVVDLLESEELADEPESERNRRLRTDAARADRALALIAKNAPRSPSDLALLLRDRSGESGQALPLGHSAQIGDPSAAHSVIIDPAALVMWVGVGPGPFGRLVAFDLRHELRGEGKRPAPPPDIASAGRETIAAAHRVNQARELLYQARRAKGRRARETLARALVLAPDLPETHELAKELGVAIK